MGAQDLLHHLTDAGLSVRVADGKLLVKPASKLTDQILAALREAKPELLALMTSPYASRRYGLTKSDANRCHVPRWDDAEISTFTQRVMIFMRQGIDAADADDLAERLVLRDRDLDSRRLCLECAHLMASGRCAAAARGDLAGVDPRLEPVQAVLQRCEAFELRERLK